MYISETGHWGQFSLAIEYFGFCMIPIATKPKAGKLKWDRVISMCLWDLKNVTFVVTIKSVCICFVYHFYLTIVFRLGHNNIMMEINIISCRYRLNLMLLRN